MVRSKSLICLMLVIVFCSITGQVMGETSIQPERKAAYEAVKTYQSKMITQEDREAAAARAAAKAARSGRRLSSVSVTEPKIGQGDVPDYFSPTVPNWAYSPKLRKFVDTLPGLGPNAENNLHQYIPVAVPDKGAYPGLTPGSTSDYYEIALVQYTQKLHSDLPPTTLRGYVQIDTPAIPDTATRFALKYPDGSPILDKAGNQVYAVDQPRYLGPMIITRRDVPVRIKFTNYLPTTANGGDLFIPVDTSVMGAGMGPNMAMPMMADRVGGAGTTVEIMTMEPHNFKAGQRVTLHGFKPAAYNGEWVVLAEGLHSKHFRVKLKSDPGGPATVLGEVMEMYTQNRAVVHLHGGFTPWISDGTPHQWITPAGENTNYPEGVSVREVPDMPGCEAADDGSTTLYYTNQQSARLMFYHDHVYGITRLNVYVGEAAGYLIQDPVEDDLVARNVIPSDQIPLIIQDKTFVDADTIGQTDPTWRWGTGADNDGNGYPDFKTGDLWVPHVYVPAQNPADLSGMNAMGRWHYGPWFWPPTTDIEFGPVPNPYFDSWAGDPTLPPPYDVDGPATRPWEPEFMPGTPDPSVGMEHYNDTPLVNGTAYPSLEVEPKAYRLRILNAANDRFFNLSLFVADPDVVTTDGRTNTEIKMVPATPTSGLPEGWPTDGREGGVPDPATAGPDWVQIGTEGGFLPAPAVIPARPTVWNWDQTTFNMGNVTDHSLLLGPAERADVIVDFSQYAGKTLIIYNDAPVAFPALDPRQDYYTGMPDMRDTGSHWPTEPGFGPNVRTIMQIKVKDTPVTDTWVGLDALKSEWESRTGHPGVFERDQDPILVGQSAYDSAYTRTGLPVGRSEKFPASGPYWGYSHIHDTSLKIETVKGDRLTIPMEPKALHDEIGAVYDAYGRMSGKLGTEVPGTNSVNQSFSLLAYVDPPTEVMKDNMVPISPVLGDGTQIWKFTHNGVDTHPIHFHLMNVQLINRVGWDGAIRLPDANELGWKETIRVSPLEDTIVALRPVAPALPFKIGDSIRLLDPVRPEGVTWASQDPLTGDPITITNQLHNFGWEYMLHCHVLSHEEMEMMRPIEFRVSPPPTAALTATASTAVPALVALNWGNTGPALAATSSQDHKATNLLVQRATDAAFTQHLTNLDIENPTATSFTDVDVEQGTTYYYRIRSENAVSYSTWSASAPVTTPAVLPAVPTELAAVVAGTRQINLSWKDNSDNEKGFRVERATVNGINVGAYSAIGSVQPNQTTYSDTTSLWGVTYIYRVVAFNVVGDAVSDGVIGKITGYDNLTLAEARTTVSDGSLVRISDVVSSGVFPENSIYYVEQLNRIAGIRVNSASQPPVGQVGMVEGRMATVNGERQIADGVFTPSGVTALVSPVMLVARHVGGGDAGLVPGMTGMMGLNNVGLLLRVSGKVVAQGVDNFTVSDGSGSVKIVLSPGVAAPQPDHSVVVTGVCSVELDGIRLTPTLLARGQSDVVDISQ